ncbi:MAG: hypothetical protein L7W43_00040, partial [Rubripirellula sp.]|nr:hypothetical protein [Rubripirellula sp.]
MSNVPDQSELRSQSGDGQLPVSDDQFLAGTGSNNQKGDDVLTPLALGDTCAVSVSRLGWRWALEVLLLVGLFFIYAGDSAPMVNEA